MSMDKIIQVKISEIKPNPFKRFINKGRFDEERIGKMLESIGHGTLPNSFFGREANLGYELSHGHHRLEAFGRAKGRAFMVNLHLVNYSDEQMLIDMLRENLSQRDSDFQDKEDSIVLAREWLQSKSKTVKQFNSLNKTGFHPEGKKGGGEPLLDSFRSIAKFLSKQGKIISYATVKNYLDIHDKSHPLVHEKIKKLESAPKKEKAENIGVRVAIALTTIPKKEQIPIFNQIIKSKINRDDAIKGIQCYRQADETTKKLVQNGKLALTDLKEQTEEESIAQEHWETGNKEQFLFQKKPQELKSNFFGTIRCLLELLAKMQEAIRVKSYNNSELNQIQKQLKDLAEEMHEIDQLVEKAKQKLAVKE